MPPDPSSASTSQARSLKKKPGQKRVRTGCGKCRTLRYKCDEQKPTCSRCQRNGTECLWPTSEAVAGVTFVPYEDIKPRSERADSIASTSAGSSSSLVRRDDRTHPRFEPCMLQHQHCMGSNHPYVGRNTTYKNPTSPLEISFPDPEERSFMSLWMHVSTTYCSRPGLRPANGSSGYGPETVDQLQSSFEMREYLTSSRGSSAAHEAFTLAFLSLGAVNVSYFHHRAALAAMDSSNPGLAAVSVDKANRFKVLSESFSSASVGIIKSLVLMMQATGRAKSDTELEFLHGALSSALMSRVFAGGEGYKAALELHRTLITLRGGPIKMLEAAKTRGRKQLRMARAKLEEVVSMEIFTSLTTGQAPSLVFPSADGGPPVSLCDWYTDLRYCPEPNAPKDASSEDWESVESIVGIPRRLFEVVYRVSTLYSVSRPVGWSQSGSNAHCAHIDHIWVAEATKLLVELNGWDYQARFEDSDEPPLKTRLDFGTKIYVRALELILRVDLLSYPLHHPAIQQPALEILDLVTACRAEEHSLMGYVWPTIIASASYLGPDSRARGHSVIEIFREISVYDVDTAHGILAKVWSERDLSREASWRSVLGEGEGLLLL